MPSNDSPSTDQPGGRPPRTILEVLCREVGAAHPDGALKQIRTMKRLLRSHYHNQQRLQRWGIDGLSEAVEHVKALQDEVRALKNAQRKRAAANVAALDEALSVVERARQRLRQRAEASDPVSKSSTSLTEKAGGQTGDTPSADVDAVLDAIEDVEAELDEMRLELWTLSNESSHDTSPHATSSNTTTPDTGTTGAGGEMHRQNGHAASADAADHPPGAAAEDRLDQLTAWLQAIARDNASLRAERDRLDAQRTTLLERLRRQQRRIAELESESQATV